MELIHDGKTIIAAVAQPPFVDKNDNVFCKLIPLFDHRDKYNKLLDKSEFYSDGEIWWKLSSRTPIRSIVPGMLREVTLEPAPTFDAEKGDSAYQTCFSDREDVLDAKAGVEVFSMPNETEKSLFRFKGDGSDVELPHLPSRIVFFKVCGFVYGPFSTVVAEWPNGTVGIRMKVKPCLESQRVFKLPESDFSQNYKSIVKPTVFVSLATVRNSPRDRGVSYEYLPPEEYERLYADLAAVWTGLDFEPLTAKVGRVVRQVKGFSRSDKQAFKALVKKLDESIGQAEDPSDLRAVTQDLAKLTDEEEASVLSLVKVLEENGLLNEERIKKAEEEYLKNWINTQAKTINERLDERKQELESLKGEIQKTRDSFELEKSRHQKELADSKSRADREASQIVEEARRAVEVEKSGWEAEKKRRSDELSAQELKVTQTLANLKSFAEQQATDIVALYPFLRDLRGAGIAQIVQEKQDDGAKVPLRQFEIPENLHTNCPGARSEVSQKDFLKKVMDYAESQGLSYDPDDLRRFHTSMLCEGLTILAGPSGVGKSSLARVYGKVLAGENAISPRDGTLVVHVSPAWIERADLLGYVNTVTGDFSPAESGLYQRLIYAQEDYRENKGDSALYPICLDEMNLSQIEHYFSDFLQLLELPLEDRVLPCFSCEAVLPTSMFRNFAKLRLPPSVKFVGTVNFDETTRRMSGRLLDRANLVYLENGMTGNVSSVKGEVGLGNGISQATYATWMQEGVLSFAVESCLQDLAPSLKTLGTAVSPRVRAAMGRYIASSLSLIVGGNAERIAFLEQIGQRVLSKVRAISSTKQESALEEVERILTDFSGTNETPAHAAVNRLKETTGEMLLSDDED